jgi:hypothetical protein
MEDRVRKAHDAFNKRLKDVKRSAIRRKAKEFAAAAKSMRDLDTTDNRMKAIETLAGPSKLLSQFAAAAAGGSGMLYLLLLLVSRIKYVEQGALIYRQQMRLSPHLMHKTCPQPLLMWTHLSSRDSPRLRLIMVRSIK